MLKINLQKIFVLIIISLISHNVILSQAAIIQNPKLTQMNDGFLEVKPNGSLVLRGGSWTNSSNIWQEAMIFKTILNAIRLMPLQSKNTLNDLNQKIYGDGVEHKFPPFLERVIQRIQTYFSVYKYTDTSKPVRVENKPTTTVTAAAPTLTAASETTLNLNDNNEIDVNLTSAFTNSFNRYNKTTATATTTSMSSVNKFTKPLKISTTTTTTTKPLSDTPIVLIDDADEENEFIEIKSNKLNSNNNKKL